MKRALLVLLLVVGFLALAVTPGYTGGHWHGGVFVGVGPYWGPYWGGYPYWGYPYWGYPGPYYAYPPPVVVTAYWYYCPSAKGYYPTVPSCPEEWVKVPERPQ
jgi:hypothetical protein